MHIKLLSAKWWPFCSGEDELTPIWHIVGHVGDVILSPKGLQNHREPEKLLEENVYRFVINTEPADELTSKGTSSSSGTVMTTSLLCIL